MAVVVTSLHGDSYVGY